MTNKQTQKTYVLAWQKDDGQLYIEQGWSLENIIDYVICYFLIKNGEDVEQENDVVNVQKHADIFVIKYMNEKHHIDANENSVKDLLEQRARTWGYTDKFEIEQTRFQKKLRSFSQRANCVDGSVNFTHYIIECLFFSAC